MPERLHDRYTSAKYNANVNSQEPDKTAISGIRFRHSRSFPEGNEHPTVATTIAVAAVVDERDGEHFRVDAPTLFRFLPR